VTHLIITRGDKGSSIYDGETGEEISIPVAQVPQVVDPTGAGDAFRGGFFAALHKGLGWEIAGRVGALCSAYCLEHVGTATHSFGWAGFADRYEQNFGREPLLEKLEI